MTHTTDTTTPAPARTRKEIADDRLSTDDGVVYRSTARAAGTAVEIVDREVIACGDPLDAYPENERAAQGRWAVVCEHGTWIAVSKLREASYVRRSPETFCDSCADAAIARGYDVDPA